MRPDEIIVARMGSGLSIGRSVQGDSLTRTQRTERVRIATGRNKVARLPADRIVLATGVVTTRVEQVMEFRQECASLSSQVDLNEIWEVVKNESVSFVLNDLAELYWGACPSPSQKVALLFRLEETDSPYFVQSEDGYVPRTQESLDEIRASLQRVADNDEAACMLMGNLADGNLPTPMNAYQGVLLEYLKVKTALKILLISIY
ncbi:MAG: hypothetical protein CFH43_01018 [Proteobacteria bacterium]|nr:MAG: hypothetical protein CFH43_01018 [Pseudomonadota bacterium]